MIEVKAPVCNTDYPLPRLEITTFNPFKIPSIIPGKDPFDISTFLEQTPLNLPNIFTEYHFHETNGVADKRRKRRLYQRLYRRIQKLGTLGLITLQKSEGFLWISRGLNSSSCIEEIMQESKNTDSDDISHTQCKGIYRLPQKRLIQQTQAIDLCLSRQMLSYPDREAIQNIFQKYLKRYETKTIHYIHSDECEPSVVSQGLCRTRFNDKGRYIRELIQFNRCWNNASEIYDKGVVIGLTTAPYNFESIYHANKHFGPELNRFLTNITYKLPRRRPYFCSYEFTRTGILHAHIAFFGVTHLYSSNEDDEIAWIKKRWSQGKRVSSEEIRKDPVWGIWYRVKTDIRSNLKECPVENTRKYLGMCLTNKLDSELYWTFGQKYFSSSKDLC